MTRAGSERHLLEDLTASTSGRERRGDGPPPASGPIGLAAARLLSPTAQHCAQAQPIHSANFDHRRVSTFPLTAIPIACFWPTTTTTFRPLVMPV